MKKYRSTLWLATLLVLAAAGTGTCGQAGVATSTSQPVAVLDWHAVVRDFAAAHFKHPAWGYSHSARCYELAAALAAADKVKLDDDVLFAAAYLHDMGAFAPWADPKTDHADIAVKEFVRVLGDTGFPAAKLDAAGEAIRTHMFARVPVGPEAVYLHDADALDWLGAVGAARLLALVDPAGGLPGTADMVKGMQANLEAVPAHVVSAAGRALLPERKAILEDYIKSLRSETGGLKNI